MNQVKFPLPESVAVLGSNGAIGAAIVSALQTHGVTVYGFDIQEQSNAEQTVPYTSLPQTSAGEYVEIFAQRVRQLRPSALVIASGVYPARTLSEETISNAQSVLTINAVLPIRCIEMFIRAHRGDPTTIIATSSLASLKSRAGISSYSASKAALENFIQAAVIEYRDSGVRINVVRPGYVTAHSPINPIPHQYQTKMDESGRASTPEQLVPTYLWLLSDASAQLNGTTIDVDRGMHLGTLDDAGWLDQSPASGVRGRL